MRFFKGFSSLTIAALAVGMVSTAAAGPTDGVADADSNVVIGKLRLIKNGDEVRLGDGWFSNRARLKIVADSGERFEVPVGKDGAVIWEATPGTYRVSGVEFMVRGDAVNVDWDLAFDAEPESQATYIGTVTLETSFSPNYYGLEGTVDTFSVTNDCSSDCSALLADTGHAEGEAVVALLRPTGPLMSSQ